MILGTDKKAAMANAKVKVFKEALLEGELEKDFELPELEFPNLKQRSALCNGYIPTPYPRER